MRPEHSGAFGRRHPRLVQRHRISEVGIKLRDLGLDAGSTPSSTVRTDNHMKIRFSATVGKEEPEIEVGLV